MKTYRVKKRKKTKFVRVKPSMNSLATEVFHIRRIKPRRWTYAKGKVMHRGKMMNQRLGWRGNKVVEVAYVPIVKVKKKK
jgi:hypothetical protein